MMKKLIIILCMVLLPLSSISQSIDTLVQVPEVEQTVEVGTSFFDKTYIRLQSGIFVPLSPSGGLSETTYVQGFELGKNISPSFGISIERWVRFSNVYGETAISFSNTSLNFRINLSNAIWGYKGEPRRVDFLLIPGIGWGKKYTNNPDSLNQDRNVINYNLFAEIDINLGKQKRCQININPGMLWYTGNGDVNFNINRSGFVLKVGFTYKFGRNGDCNFHNRKKYVKKEDYMKLYNAYRRLKDK